MFQMQNSMDSFGMGMLATVLWCQINHCLSFRPFPLFWTQACPHAKLTGNAHICLPTLRSACWTPGHTLAPVIFGPKQFLYLLAWNLNAHFPHNETWQEKQKSSQERTYLSTTQKTSDPIWSHRSPPRQCLQPIIFWGFQLLHSTYLVFVCYFKSSIFIWRWKWCESIAPQNSISSYLTQ